MLESELRSYCPPVVLREGTAYFTTYRGVAKVVLASGLTIAGALYCLSFTRLPFFNSSCCSETRTPIGEPMRQ